MLLIKDGVEKEEERKKEVRIKGLRGGPSCVIVAQGVWGRKLGN